MVIPSALQFTADRLMNSAGRVGTADNDINALRNMGMIPGGYSINHYLTDTCLLYTSPSPRDRQKPRMPSSA